MQAGEQTLREHQELSPIWWLENYAPDFMLPAVVWQFAWRSHLNGMGCGLSQLNSTPVDQVPSSFAKRGVPVTKHWPGSIMPLQKKNPKSTKWCITARIGIQNLKQYTLISLWAKPSQTLFVSAKCQFCNSGYKTKIILLIVQKAFISDVIYFFHCKCWGLLMLNTNPR